jgi:hypothetical protein
MRADFKSRQRDWARDSVDRQQCPTAVIAGKCAGC